MAFLPEAQTLSLSDLWVRCLQSCAWFQRQFEAGETVTVMLDNSAASLSTLVGAWLAGLDVASVPLPPRRTTLAEHLAEMQRCTGVETRMAFVAARHLDDLDATTCRTFEEVSGYAGRRACPIGGGSLIQCSSGTTGDPKGVVLSLSALAANVEAIIDVFENGEPLISVSWLPLSHDMGLIGLCLAPWAYAAQEGGGTIGLIQPDAFLRSPSIWLAACTELQAAATCGPNFALDLVARRGPSRGVDLAKLRILCVGSEPVRAHTLRAFSAAVDPTGFDARALCPAYGLAESSLAVTCVRPEQVWHSVTIDTAAFGKGDWLVAEAGIELVSCGPPVRGVDVALSDESEVLVRGPSMFERYVGGDSRPTVGDGWFGTGDTGALHDGELYVTGRLDDRLRLAGRTIHTVQIEDALQTVAGIAAGRSTVIADESGGYVIVAERIRRAMGAEQLAAAAKQVHVEATGVTGLAPARVVLVEPGSFPTTANGKVRRRAVRAAYWANDLAIEWEAS
jgi:acyl-CoA synthetase (AMP-forming)/AMP-acid ligase II